MLHLQMTVLMNPLILTMLQVTVTVMMEVNPLMILLMTLPVTVRTVMRIQTMKMVGTIGMTILYFM